MRMAKISSLELLVRGLSVTALLGFILFTGCTYFKNKDEYYTLNRAPGTFHKIEAIELKEAGEDEIPGLKMDKPAPADLNISLEECRVLVLKNNLDLKVQLILPAISAEYVTQAEAAFEPDFWANARYLSQNSPVQSLIELNGNKITMTTTNLGVNIPFKTGGEISTSLNDSRFKTDSPYSIFNPSYSSVFSASISQPLLQGVGIGTNTHAIRIAEYDRRITEAQTKRQVIKYIQDVDYAYWNLYTARKSLDVTKQQYQYSKTLFENAKHKVETGTQAQIDLIRAKADVAEKAANIIKDENNVRDRERELKELINRDRLGVETETVLVPSTEPVPVHYDIQSDQMLAKALENRMEMLESELEIAKDDRKIDGNRNDSLPSVDITYTYRMNGRGTSRSDSFDLLSENKFKDHQVDLDIKLPLGNKAAKSKLQQAKYSRAQNLIRKKKQKMLIEYDVLTRIDQLETNWQRIVAGRKMRIYREQQYQAEKHNFEVGLGTSIDVLDVQNNLASAQKQEIDALAAYQKSLVDLAVATGTLLEAVNIRWEPFVQKDEL